jgi:hypothetical protein
MRAEKNSNGDWLISIIQGSKNAGDVRMQVMNTNGTAALNVYPVNTLAAPQGVFNDLNSNNKIDAGDNILLYNAAHGGSDLAGLKLQLLKGESIIGTIKELPS